MARPHSFSAWETLAASQGRSSERVYTLCVFDEALIVPWVQLLDASDDVEAMDLARSVRPSKRRELWHGHRFVADVR